MRKAQVKVRWNRTEIRTVIFFIFLFCAIFSFSQKKYEKDLNAVSALYDNGKYAEAINLSEEILKKDDKKIPVFDLSLFHVKMALSYTGLGRNADAEKYFLLSIRDFKDSTEDTKYQQAMHKYYLANLYNNTGRYDEADVYYRQSLPLLAVAFGQTSKEYCKMYAECAKMYVEMGRYPEALPMIEGTVYFYRILYGEKDKEFLNALNDLARIYQGTGNYQYASLYFDTIISSYARYYKDKEPENYAVIINNAGENYRLMGDYELAEQYLIESYRQSDSFPGNRATVLNNIGLVYKARGLYNEAERSFNEAISIYEKQGKGNSLDATFPWNGIGDLYRVTGRYRQAIAAFQKVINIREGVGGTNHTNYANVIVNVALTYSDLNMNAEAEALLKKAYVIYFNLLGDDHVLTANCLNNMGSMRLKANDLDEAERYKLKAIEIYKKIVGEKNDRYAAFLSGLMLIYEKKNQLDKAMEIADKIDKILKESFGETNYDYFNNVFNKAELYRKMGKPEKAQEFFISGIEGYKKLLKDFFPYMNEDEKTAVNYSLSVRFESFANFVFEAKEKKWPVNSNTLNAALANFQLSNKSSLLNETADFQRKVYASKDSSIIDSYEYLVEMKKYIGNKYRMSKEALEANGIYVDSLEMAAGKLEKELNTKLNAISSPIEITWDNVAAKLDKKSAAIEIVRTENWVTDTLPEIKYAALIIKNGAPAPELVLLDNGNKLDAAWVKEYREKVLDRKPDSNSYARYWKPLSGRLKGIENIYFSGDGIYLQISLNSLWNPITGKFLLEEKNLHFLTNTKDLLKTDASTAGKKNGIFFGYPDYEYDFVEQRRMKELVDAKGFATRFGFYELDALPGTKKEVLDIAEVFRTTGFPPTTYLKETASEKNLKAVKSPLVLHIATHGFFLPDVKTNDKKILGFSTEKVQQNPLLRSGLMLAGASVVARDTATLHERDDDGILTAYEASMLNLQGTEIVVLSACKTGLGETFDGQGVYGLQRAFLVAGARSVIMSMWIVDDYATQELMLEFYKEWLKNPVASNKLPCFKKAQLKVKEKYKDPFFWGAFVLLER
jgi:tetratricopeptide (TPR) repeat protein